VVSAILFDIVLSKKLAGAKAINFETGQVMYSFLYNFFAIVSVTFIYLALKIAYANYSIFLLYIFARGITIIICTLAAKILSKNQIAILFIAIIFGILLTISLSSF
jgi:uncharacterized membrane protein YccC